jgi:Icc-related predicted phosphoesterase
MRFLAVTDFHNDYSKLPEILKKAGKVDGTLLAGDLTEFGPTKNAEKLLKELPKPILAIPGNCDQRDMVELLKDKDVNLHENKRRIGDITFIGMGGSNPTPFNTPFEYSEEEIGKTVERLLKGVSGTAILIAHAPPKGHGDTIPNGAHVGSTAVADVAPKFAAIVCGHIHEDRSISMLGNTLVVNPGPAMAGNAAVLNVDNNGHITAKLI